MSLIRLAGHIDSCTELYRGHFLQRCSFYQKGVLLYALLCGFLPFEYEHLGRLFQKMIRGIYDIPSWLSTEAVDLLSEMLKCVPKQRTSLKSVMAHLWASKGNAFTSESKFKLGIVIVLTHQVAKDLNNTISLLPLPTKM